MSTYKELVVKLRNRKGSMSKAQLNMFVRVQKQVKVEIEKLKSTLIDKRIHGSDYIEKLKKGKANIKKNSKAKLRSLLRQLGVNESLDEHICFDFNERLYYRYVDETKFDRERESLWDAWENEKELETSKINKERVKKTREWMSKYSKSEQKRRRGELLALSDKYYVMMDKKEKEIDLKYEKKISALYQKYNLEEKSLTEYLLEGKKLPKEYKDAVYRTWKKTWGGGSHGSDSKIRKMRSEFNNIRKKFNLPPIKNSKHGYNEKGVLPIDLQKMVHRWGYLTKENKYRGYAIKESDENDKEKKSLADKGADLYLKATEKGTQILDDEYEDDVYEEDYYEEDYYEEDVSSGGSSGGGASASSSMGSGGASTGTIPSPGSSDSFSRDSQSTVTDTKPRSQQHKPRSHPYGYSTPYRTDCDEPKNKSKYWWCKES